MNYFPMKNVSYKIINCWKTSAKNVGDFALKITILKEFSYSILLVDHLIFEITVVVFCYTYWGDTG